MISKVNQLIPRVYDLFGDIPVTEPEIEAWMQENAPRYANSPRRGWYVENWRVADKVKAEKKARK